MSIKLRRFCGLSPLSTNRILIQTIVSWNEPPFNHANQRFWDVPQTAHHPDGASSRFSGVSVKGIGKLEIIKKGGAVSRFLFLNLSFIYATYPLTSDGQSSSVSIFGLAGPCIVPWRRHRRQSWALAPRFHPYRRKDPKVIGNGGSFLLRCHKITPI